MSGILIVVFGAVLVAMAAGVALPPALVGERRFVVRPSVLGAWAPPVMGMAFAFAWTPCIGPVLGSVLTLAAGTGGSATGGIALLLAYSLGLGRPVPAQRAGLRPDDRRAGPGAEPAPRRRPGGRGVLVVFGLLLLTGNVGTRLRPHLRLAAGPPPRPAGHQLSAGRPRRPGGRPGPAWLPDAGPRSMGHGHGPQPLPPQQSPSATRSRCRGGSRSSPGSTSRSPRGRPCWSKGPNGAGKTSLLRVCAGLVPLASGQVASSASTRSATATAVRRRVGLLSHASHLYDDLTVGENVRFAVRAAGADPDGSAPACDRLGLVGRLLRTPAAKLSAGQRRRVALAVLAARWPELWLLDEPHAGLDAAARATARRVDHRGVAAGVTVVIASHEADLVESLATGRSPSPADG